MINHISKMITNFFLQQKSISEDEKEIYQYGVEITISSILNILLVLLLSMLFRSVLSGIVFLVCFIYVRRYTGGYHAETYFRCNSALCITYIAVFIISKGVHISNVVFLLIILIGLIIVIRYSPVNNTHKSLSGNEKKRYHYLAVTVYIIFSIIGFFIIEFNIFYGKIILLTLLSIALIIIIEIILQGRGIHES